MSRKSRIRRKGAKGEDKGYKREEGERVERVEGGKKE